MGSEHWELCSNVILDTAKEVLNVNPIYYNNYLIQCIFKYITVCRDNSQLIPITTYKQSYIDAVDKFAIELYTDFTLATT